MYSSLAYNTLYQKKKYSEVIFNFAVFLFFLFNLEESFQPPPVNSSDRHYNPLL